MEGRITRSTYFWMTFALTLITYAMAFMAGLFMGATGATSEAAEAIGGVIGLGMSVVIAFQVVKRLHDLDRPGWHYWLLLVPLYNFYLGIILLFQQGTPGTNAYGEDPMGA
jgi:uncharacterized membrane protein YhaH (DUF805 family)